MATFCGNTPTPDTIIHLGELCLGGDPADDAQLAWEYGQDEVGMFFPSGSCPGKLILRMVNGRVDAACVDPSDMTDSEWAVWGSGDKPCPTGETRVDGRCIDSSQATNVASTPSAPTKPTATSEVHLIPAIVEEARTMPSAPMLPLTGIDAGMLSGLGLGMLLSGIALARLSSYFADKVSVR